MNKLEIITIRKPCPRWGKRAVLRLDLKVDRVAVCLRERESLFQEEGPKAENDREPTVERFVLGMRKLKVSEAERRVRVGVYNWVESQR